MEGRKTLKYKHRPGNCSLLLLVKTFKNFPSFNRNSQLNTLRKKETKTTVANCIGLTMTVLSSLKALAFQKTDERVME